MMKQPNAKQKRWLKDIADFVRKNGHVIEYAGLPDVQLHHTCGRSYIHNKIAIGHWFVLPIPFNLHDVSKEDAPLHVGSYPKSFTEHYGKERDIFARMVENMRPDYDVPPDDVLKSISDTRF